MGVINIIPYLDATEVVQSKCTKSLIAQLYVLRFHRLKEVWGSNAR